jgi:hypothetical protein
MKKQAYIYVVSLLLLLGTACSKMNDYRKDFTDGRERIYTGKADSVKVFPGKNRVLLQWLYVADPKVKRAKVFWNNRRDSTAVDITRTSGVDTIRLIINNLPEGSYNFEIVSYDADANPSVTVTRGGVVFGESYQAALLNRLIKKAEIKSGYAEITWYNADQYVLATELKYINTADEIIISRILPGMDTTQLAAYKAGTKFEYRTLYLPDSLSIDTFYTAWQQKGVTADITSQYLKNAGFPFVAAVMANSRFGTLADWITNNAAKNINGQGGYDNYPGYGTLGFEYWSTPAINNGKIHQEVILPAGKYKLQATVQEIANSLPETYLLAVAGSGLPDAVNYSQSLGYAKFTNNSLNNKTLDADFTLNTQMTVSLGVVANMVSGNQNLRVKGIKLFSIGD